MTEPKDYTKLREIAKRAMARGDRVSSDEHDMAEGILALIDVVEARAKLRETCCDDFSQAIEDKAATFSDERWRLDGVGPIAWCPWCKALRAEWAK